MKINTIVAYSRKIVNNFSIPANSRQEFGGNSVTTWRTEVTAKHPYYLRVIGGVFGGNYSVAVTRRKLPADLTTLPPTPTLHSMKHRWYARGPTDLPATPRAGSDRGNRTRGSVSSSTRVVRSTSAKATASYTPTAGATVLAASSGGTRHLEPSRHTDQPEIVGPGANGTFKD